LSRQRYLRYFYVYTRLLLADEYDRRLDLVLAVFWVVCDTVEKRRHRQLADTDAMNGDEHREPAHHHQHTNMPRSLGLYDTIRYDTIRYCVLNVQSKTDGQL